MADQLPDSDDDGIEWTKATRKNGVPFEVGIVRRTEGKGASPSPLPVIARYAENSFRDHREDFKRPRALEKYDFPVNWPVGDDAWK